MQTMSFVRSISVVALLIFFTPAEVWACPICFGLETGSDEARSLNWAVFTLLGVTGGVLSGFVAFMFHLLKRSRQALGNEGAVDSQVQHVGSKGRA
ncbi:MAG TPA: hypothetical protein EYO94_04620 [Acidobacteria bacterium]|nr:hypothetical protein [Acidobacteriota bacterium]HIM15819.1 hypothetical protein [Acidobacteriota bacterium]